MRSRGVDLVRQAIRFSREHPLKAAGVGAAGLLSIVVMVVVGVWLISLGGNSDRVTAEQVLKAYEQGEFTEAEELAKTLRDQPDPTSQDIAAATFVLGAIAAGDADNTFNEQRRKKYRVAARYLEEARDRGFPLDHAADGLFMLGKSLYESGRIPAARPVLVEALRVKKDKRWAIYRLLSGAYLDDTRPDLEKALHYNTLYLSHELPSTERQEALLQRAKILLASNEDDACAATLKEIPKDSKYRAEATILHGRMLMRQAATLKEGNEPSPRDLQRSRDLYQQAIKALRLAQGLDTLSNKATRKAMYLIGVCYKELGDYRAAERQFVRTRKLFPETAEGTAASFEEGGLARELGRDKSSLAAYARAMKTLGEPGQLANPWIPVERMREGILEAYTHYLDTANYPIALKLTKLLDPLFPKARVLELTAEVHERWGKMLLAEAAQLPADKARPLLTRGRLQYREAGSLRRKLADELLTSRRYPDELWTAARDYMRGQGFTAAIGVLRDYLKDQTRKRHPQALVMLGRAFMALGNVDKALQSLDECTEFHPSDASAYEARLLAARAYQEKGEPQEAEKLLLKNLAGEFLTPASREWRNSLFDLGDLLFRQERYEEAAHRLEEAVARYPDDPRAAEARYLLAESYRREAKSAQEKLRTQLAGSARGGSTRHIGRLMHQALEQYTNLRDQLGRRQETAELDQADRVILRNAYFAIGALQYDLGKFKDAIDTYSTITNRYQNHPEVLDAYVQIANAYRRLGEPGQAQSTLEQAKIVLKRMSDDAEFSATTNQSREQWSELLELLSKL